MELIKTKEAKLYFGDKIHHLYKFVQMGWIRKVGKLYVKEDFKNLYEPFQCNINTKDEYIKWFSENCLNSLKRIDSTKMEPNSLFNIKYKNFINKINDFIEPELNHKEFREKWYCLVNNINVSVKCLCCNNEVEFTGRDSFGYLETCSLSCSHKLYHGLRYNSNFKYPSFIRFAKEEEKVNKIIEKEKKYYKKLSDYAKIRIENLKLSEDYYKLTNWQRRDLKTKQIMINDVDENGLNGFQRQALKAKKN